jgi:error-prone DNA polymerase
MRPHPSTLKRKYWHRLFTVNVSNMETLFAPAYDALGVIPAARLAQLDHQTRVLVGGIVTHRQRPPSAGGVTFISLEDETGLINIIVPQTVWARHRRVARDAGALLIRGMLERTHDVTNVMAERIDKLVLGVRPASRDFR